MNLNRQDDSGKPCFFANVSSVHSSLFGQNTRHSFMPYEYPISSLSDDILLKEFIIEIPKWIANLKERIQAKLLPSLEYR